VLPQRLHPTLAGLAAQVAPDHDASPHRGREASGAWRARRARWPAIAVGTLEDEAWSRDSRTDRDTPDRVDPRAMRDGLAFALAIVRALDDDLAERVP
jgi:hypothetical protein